MSINSLLGTARLGLAAQQAAIQTVGHNITNATTEGYSRQRAVLQPHLTGGVLLSDIEHIRDTLLDSVYRRQLPQSSGHSTRFQILSYVSEIFNEPSENGLSSTLDQFWNAWSDLANMPDSAASRSVIQQRGDQLAQMLNRYSSDLDAIAESQLGSVEGLISRFNQLTDQIADLNKRIIAFEAGGSTASDLRDTRDLLTDELAGLIPVNVIEQKTGSYTIYISGTSIVDGISSKELTLSSDSGGLSVSVNGRQLHLGTPDGSIGAIITALNVDIPEIRSELDTIAGYLVSTVNSIHREGWTATGELAGISNWDDTSAPTGSNIDFFDPTGTSAATIRLSSHVSASASYIAAGNVFEGSGNNATARELAQLRDAGSIPRPENPSSSISVGEYYRDLVTRTGVSTNDARTSTQVYSTLAQNADVRRMSSSGVSIDEELVALTIHQQAYAAAARVVTTADSMAQTLLDMVR